MEECLSYDRFITHHRNQINPEPHPESTLTFAYGNLKYGKNSCFNPFVDELEKNLLKKDDVLRKKVLIEINEDFHQADKLNFALESSGILV